MEGNKELLEGNIARLIIDSELKDKDYNKVVSYIESCSPYIFDIKNEYEDKIQELKDDFVVDDINISKTVEEYIEIIDIKHKKETLEYLKEKLANKGL